jgi:hypothetical protein
MCADCCHDAAEAASVGSPKADKRHDRHYGYHRTLLWMAVAAVVAACLLRVRPDEKVEFTILQGWPAPELCQSRAWLGWDCPGCGLTRSFIHLAHGDVASSLAVHRIGWLVALWVVLQLPYRVWAMRSAHGQPLGRVFPWVVTWSLMALLIANWITKIVVRLM